jgi:hypothetical protein
MPQTRKDGPYRITGLHPWPSAGPADDDEPLRRRDRSRGAEACPDELHEGVNQHCLVSHHGTRPATRPGPSTKNTALPVAAMTTGRMIRPRSLTRS